MHGKKQQQYSDAPEITEAKPKRGVSEVSLWTAVHVENENLL